MGSANPTTVRWRVVVLLMAFGFMSHFNRVSMSVAADERIMEQHSISPTRMGTVYSAFLLVYTIFMIPGGLFIDRFGPRTALVVMGLGSAFFCMLTGLIGFLPLAAGGLLGSFFVIRALMGLFSTPLYPGGARIISHWIPTSHRARANGWVTGAAPLGIATTYVVFGSLIRWFDWPIAFLITGTATAILAWVWTATVTDYPSQHRAVNPAECELIEKTQERADPTATSRVGSTGVLTLLKNRSLVLLTLSYAAVSYFQYLFFYWMHYYFDKVLHLGTNASQFYAAIPPLAMALGMPLGGWLSDRMRTVLGRRRGFALVAAGGMVASAALLGLGVLVTEPIWIVLWFSLALGAVGISEAPFWVTAVELGGRRGGTAAAIVNTGGNGGGLLAPVVTPWVSSLKLLGWAWGIGLGGLICLLGAVCWLWIVPSDRTGNANETRT